MVTIPAKNTSNKRLTSKETLLALKRKNPMIRLAKAHSVFVREEDKPLPEGFANGVGKALPESPCTKWGIAFNKETPAKNAARKLYQWIASILNYDLLLLIKIFISKKIHK